jgi:putative transcription factor
MDCDLCGKQAIMIARIEGAQLTVCASCGKHGTLVKQLPVQTKTLRTTSQLQAAAAAKSAVVKEELIETVRKDVGKLLRTHREKLGLNQEQFAAKLQIRASTYHHYESGATVPDIAAARKLEQVLKVPLVVHVKVSSPVGAARDEQRSMTLGDFVRR